MKKTDLPVAITTTLGIPTFNGSAGPWLSAEGTVIQQWFEAVAELLGLPYTGKVGTMQIILNHFGVPWDSGRHSSTDAPQGGGGNVRKEAFEDLLEAIESDSRTDTLAAVASGTPFGSSGEVPDIDETRVLRAIRARRGQPRFRLALLEAYEGRCALTGCDAPAALEAAHIERHSDGGTYEPSNGLLLRADLHTLFDLGLLGIDHQTGRALLHPELRGTSYEDELYDAVLRSPTAVGARPDRAALIAHNERSGLV